MQRHSVGMALHYIFSMNKLLRNTTVVYGSKHMQIETETELFVFKYITTGIQSWSDEKVFERLLVHCAVYKEAM